MNIKRQTTGARLSANFEEDAVPRLWAVGCGPLGSGLLTLESGSIVGGLCLGRDKPPANSSIQPSQLEPGLEEFQ